MPYRLELRRPDLKGSFQCGLCKKVFCHSSSLSRHRMQAHFKSYTCTFCDNEIGSNETLKSHMASKHQISRMFMCRCCNWAFPDKTSLHAHVQAYTSTGSPGEGIPIIAKTTIGPGGAGSPGCMDYEEPDDEYFQQLQAEQCPDGTSPDSGAGSSSSGSDLANLQHSSVFVKEEVLDELEKDPSPIGISRGGVVGKSQKPASQPALSYLKSTNESFTTSQSASPLNSLLYKKRLSKELRQSLTSPYSTLNGNHSYKPLNLSGKPSPKKPSDDVTASRHGSDGISPNSLISNSNTSGSTSPSIGSPAAAPKPSSLIPNPIFPGTGLDPVITAALLSSFSAQFQQVATAAGGLNPLTTCYLCGILHNQLGLCKGQNEELGKKLANAQKDLKRQKEEFAALQASTKRSQTEGLLLKSHCEHLEQKILTLQEESLAFLKSSAAGTSSDPGTFKLFLGKLLDTCRIGTAVSQTF